MSHNKRIVDVLDKSGIASIVGLTETSPLVIELGRVAKEEIKAIKAAQDKPKNSYKSIFKHPITGKYELALYIPNHFGDEIAGVKFNDSKTIYESTIVEKLGQTLRTFWARDVIDAFSTYIQLDQKGMSPDEKLVGFLNAIERQYSYRWHRDPEGGCGAVEWLRDIREGSRDL